MIVIAESLARVIAAIRITRACWQTSRPPKHRNWSSETLHSLRCVWNRAIGVHLCYCFVPALRFGVTRKDLFRFVPLFKFSSGLFRFVVLVSRNAPICSDLFSEQISRNQGNPFLPTPFVSPRPGKRHLKSGKEKAHKHKPNFPVTAQVGEGVSRPGGQGSPDRWPGVKSLCAVCGTQGT